MMRQPIVSVLGHVDHGKTTLLDTIRGTAVAAKEAGFITQHTGASEIPLDAVKKLCGKMLSKMKLDIKVPGLLFVDTPGHEAFTSIRKRGSSIADLAILVVDINEGFMPQTDEALNFLKEFKTPFVVAVNKIDKIQGWRSKKGACFLDSFEEQQDYVKGALEEKFYKLVGQLSERGFRCERFDRITDFRKEIALVPCSGLTGEGVPELLMILIGLAQTFLKDELEIKSEHGKGSVLEVKEVRGLGTTLDVILYDGKIRRGDWLIIGGKEPIVAKIRSLLKPKPLKEMRIEKEFENFDEVTAAAGVKISAPGIEGAVAGSPIRTTDKESEIDGIKKELQSEFESIEIDTTEDGISIRADTIGSLEALIYMMKQKGIPIRKAEVGPPTKKDLPALEIVKDPLKKVMLVFNMNVPEDLIKEAKDKGIKIISQNIIYRLFEEYEAWVNQMKENIRKEKLASINWPAKMKVLTGFVFRQSKPAIVGIEILAGKIRTGVRVQKNGKEIGIIKDIQSEGEHVNEASAGQKVAISIDGGVVGKNFDEGDELSVVLFKRDIEILEEMNMPEAELARETMSK